MTAKKRPFVCRSTACALVLVAFSAAALFTSSSFAQKPKRRTADAEKADAAKSDKKSAKASPAKSKEPAGDDESSDQDRRKLSELRDEETLPRLQELTVPTTEELQKRPVDWIVLKGPNKGNELVVVTRPVFPRPDTLKKLEAALEELRRKPRPATEEERLKLAAQRVDLQNLIITLPDDKQGQLYEIPTNVINHIVYHEDLIIRRAGLLIEEQHFRDAFEMLYSIERDAPTWNGLKEATQRLLFLESEQASGKGDPESALASLEELESRNRDYPRLQTRLGEVVDQLIERSRRENDYRQARHFLGRLARIEPKHETVAKWKSALMSEARQLLDTAVREERESKFEQAVSSIDLAARVWPTLSELKEVHRRLSRRYQRLPVGVLSLAGQAGTGPIHTLAGEREARLTRFNLFDVDRIDDATHYRSRLLEQWEPTDLGRRAVFTLKSTRARWESRPIVTATAVLSTMESFLNPSGPDYDERFANFVDGIHWRSPYQFEVQFSRAPPRTELLFRFPIASRGAAANSSPSRILSQRFEKVRATADETVYRRFVPQPDHLEEYRLAEIVERRYETPQHAIQGLQRGDVSMLPDLPPWAVAVFRENPAYFVLDYVQPTTHVLQFNPHSQPLLSRELRMALACAIDSRRILSQIVLRDDTLQYGRIVTAPFATTSYAYDTLVKPRDYSATLAFALNDAAVKRLKTAPKLRLVCDPGASARSAAAELVKQWTRIGIHVELSADLPSAGDNKPSWDIAYRTLRMEEPLVELWPFLTVERSARLESLRHLPDWLRVELLDLDNATDWKSAVEKLQKLQSHLYAEVAYIPLWEVDDSIVLRKNVHEFSASKFISTYQDVERWIVQPWFPEDAP